MLTWQRSAAATTLPALVPTIRSTSLIGHGSSSASAGSAPVIQAAPSTPPAPSTRPPRGLDLGATQSGPMLTSAACSLQRQTGRGRSGKSYVNSTASYGPQFTTLYSVTRRQ